MPPRQTRFQSLTDATLQLLETSPAENTCLDFKRTAQSVTPEYLAAIANAAALAGESHATILIGVGEAKDPVTGVTVPDIVGLEGDLQVIEESILHRSSETHPQPVHVEITEENVSKAPVLRVDVSPTLPPHYDSAGRRGTRQGKTTRGMSDPEVLELFEQRERGKYQEVAEDTADRMMGDFRVITEDAESRQAEHFGDVRDMLQMIYERFDEIEHAIGNLPEPTENSSIEIAFLQLRHSRTMGAIAITQRIDELTDDEIAGLEEVLNSATSVTNWVENVQEINAWRKLIGAFMADEGSVHDAARDMIETVSSAATGNRYDLRQLVEESVQGRAKARADRDRLA